MFKLNPLVAAISIAIVSPMAAFAADTGDAPASYGLAEHTIQPASPYIGEQSPDDNAPVNSQDALGDDNGNVVDDEDGVFAFPQLVENAKSMNVNVFVSNPSSQDATLVGWIDFDGNGTFDADEAATAIVPAGSSNVKVKLLWPDTFGISTDYDGLTYARFRISNDPLQVSDSFGLASNGEVEDYTLTIQEDSDGDEIPNTLDLDNDNDGIPDAVEGVNVDTDGDGTFDYLDVDSDDDSIPDFAEAGPDANNPQDTDGDTTPDYLDTDSNNDGVPDIAGDASDSDADGIADSIEGSIDSDGDGIINSLDIDSDNDLIPDAVELGVSAPTPVDTDGDKIPDYLDLDSDNDGIPDMYESNTNEISERTLDADTDGQVDTGQVFGANGYVDDIETADDSGVPIFAIPDTDADGVRDFRDTDSDNDGTFDVVESGGSDADNNGLVDAIVDANGNGIPDSYDIGVTGGVDTNGNGIDDAVDAAFASGADADNDGIIDTVDLDIDGDGIVDSIVSNAGNDLFRDGVLPDVDGDFMPDFRDQDSVAGSATGGTAGTTAGTTTTGTTDTTGGTTDTTGGTTPVEPTTTGGTTTDGIVETGLSGSACSISDAPGRDPLFPGLVFMSAAIMFIRRKLNG